MRNHPGIRQMTRRIGLWRFSSVELLGLLVLFIFGLPFVEDIPGADFVEPTLLTLLLISALLAIGGRRKVLISGMLLLAPVLLFRWTTHLSPELLSPVAFLGFGLLFVGFVIVKMLRYILRASQVNAEVVCAGISVYLLIGLMWGLIYKLLGDMNPNSFSFNNPGSSEHTMTNSNAFYFSFATISSVGYGDITPVSKVARMFSVLEAIIGLFYMAVMISRLVTLYSPNRFEPDKKS